MGAYTQTAEFFMNPESVPFEVPARTSQSLSLPLLLDAGLAAAGRPAYGHSLALNEWATYPSGARRADPLAADVETVTGDMLAFATLLRPVGLPELTQGYESLSMDSSIDGPGQAVEMARECFPIGRSRCGDAGRPAGIRC